MNKTAKFQFHIQDLSAGIVVFLVALPLCLGIALASNAPLMSGLISGIIGGLVVSLLSGSQLSVSGPAAGLAVIVASQISGLGSFEIFLSAVVFAGIFQIIFGALRMGGFADYVPNSVIRGMLVGIGVIIIYKQLSYAFGLDSGFESDVSFLDSRSHYGFIEKILSPLSHISTTTLLISSTSILLLVCWDILKKRGNKFFEYFPGPLAVVFFGVAFNQILVNHFPELALTAADGKLVDIPLFESLNQIYTDLPKPDFSHFFTLEVIQAGFIIALIASIETLLSIEATDKIDPYHRISSTNRELLAQGTGNLFCGLLGGLPMTAVIVRSSANVQAGSKTRMSSFYHGIFLLLSILVIPHFLNQIPLACLAAILIVIGFKLASVAVIKKFFRSNNQQRIPFFITLFTIVLIDLLSGVIVGTVVGMFFALRANSHAIMTVVNDENSYLLRFNKDVSFVHKSMLKDLLEKVPDNVPLFIDGSRALFIDNDIVEVIEDYVKSAERSGCCVNTRNIFRN